MLDRKAKSQEKEKNRREKVKKVNSSQVVQIAGCSRDNNSNKKRKASDD